MVGRSPQVRHTICAVVLCSLLVTAASMQSPGTFRAAVYEHKIILPAVTDTPVTRLEALQNMQMNLNIYRTQAIKAKEQGAQILVFPEDGLYGFTFTRETIYPYLEAIPGPETTTWSPCSEPDRFRDTEVVRSLSCMAKENSLYIVANVGDKVKCAADCPDNGWYQYNTAIAFGPDGTILQKYHKTNLYKEAQFDTDSPDSQIKYFDTPFGRFGFLICFDILFRDPAVPMIKDQGIRNVVFTTAWMDAMPMLSAIGWHSSFARGMGVNVLSANLHIPKIRAQGSGLYTPEGMKSFYYNSSAVSEGKLIVSDLKILKENERTTNKRDVRDIRSVNEINGQQSIKNYHNGIQFEYNNYTFVPLTEANTHAMVCRKNGEYGSTVCCHLSYRIRKTPSGELLVLGAFNGRRKGKLFYETCTVMRCRNNDRTLCGKWNYDSNTSFSTLKMKADLQTPYVFPQVLLANGGQLKLAEARQWHYDNREIRLAAPHSPVLHASIVGRYYDRDAK